MAVSVQGDFILDVVGEPGCANQLLRAILSNGSRQYAYSGGVPRLASQAIFTPDDMVRRRQPVRRLMNPRVVAVTVSWENAMTVDCIDHTVDYVRRHFDSVPMILVGIKEPEAECFSYADRLRRWRARHNRGNALAAAIGALSYMEVQPSKRADIGQLLSMAMCAALVSEQRRTRTREGCRPAANGS